MPRRVSVDEIRQLGFEWPKHTRIDENCVTDHGKVDLAQTLERLCSSQAFYQSQLTQAHNFKMQTGADYSDFTDRHDEYALASRELGQAIAYLEAIIEAAGEESPRGDLHT